MKTIWFLIVFAAGALLPFQAGLNAKLGKATGNPAYASMLCFVVGALAMLLYLPFTKESASWESTKSAPLISLLGGGIAGAIFITSTMLALLRIGIAVTMGLVVAGQILAAVLLDHFGVLVDGAHQFNALRLAGIVCIIVGVVLVQKF